MSAVVLLLFPSISLPRKEIWRMKTKISIFSGNIFERCVILLRPPCPLPPPLHSFTPKKKTVFFSENYLWNMRECASANWLDHKESERTFRKECPWSHTVCENLQSNRIVIETDQAINWIAIWNPSEPRKRTNQSFWRPKWIAQQTSRNKTLIPNWIATEIWTLNSFWAWRKSSLKFGPTA